MQRQHSNCNYINFKLILVRAEDNQRWWRIQNLMLSPRRHAPEKMVISGRLGDNMQRERVKKHSVRSLIGSLRYVAAKTHYFGVGGGTRMFEDLVKERGDFTINVCKEYKQGKYCMYF